jgi:Protein of unknown function (DUF2846)
MMTKYVSLLILLLVSFLLSSCASVPMADHEQDQEAKQFKAPAGKSRIFIYRNETFGSAIKIAISVDGKLIGQTALKTYFVVDVEPGQHQIDCFSESTSQVNLTTKENEISFVWQEVKMGLMSAGCAMHEVSADEGKEKVLLCDRAQEHF